MGEITNELVRGSFKLNNMNRRGEVYLLMKYLILIINKTTMNLQLEPLFTIDELSNQIGINKYTLYKKIRENKFPRGVKINGKRKWKPEVIKDYYKELGIQVQIV